MDFLKHLLPFCLFTLIGISGCSDKVYQEEEDLTIIPTVEQDSLIYIGFDILNDQETNEKSIQINNLSISQALLKEDITTVPTIPKNKIRCSLLDQNENLIKSTLVDNPLIENLEYIDVAGHDHSHDHDDVDEDETMELKRKDFIKAKGYFGFRARYNSNIQFVLVELVDENANPVMTKKFNL